MRRLFLALGAVLLVVAGAGLWFGYRAIFLEHDNGEVLGEETNATAFWDSRALVLTGSGGLAAWSTTDGIKTVSDLVGRTITSAAQSEDGRLLLLAVKEGGGTALWLYGMNEELKLLAAIRGRVRDMNFNPSGDMVSFFEDRSDISTNELESVNVTSGKISRVAINATSSTWLPENRGILVRDRNTQLWFYGEKLKSGFDNPKLITSSTINPIVLENGSTVLIGRKNADDLEMYIQSLVTKDERKIATIKNEATADCTAYGSGHDSIALLFRNQGEENATLILLNRKDGTTTQTGLTAKRLKWLDDGSMILERVQAGKPSLWLYHSQNQSSEPLAGGIDYQLAS